ncbi:MAG: sigma-70 family RNA polymerase sigma factor [Candidatus Rokuibacteriota bacterium]
MSSDDRILVERCQAGDLTAFEPLVEKYRQRVWRLAHNVLRDREEAWDVAQEAFIRAYQALPSFRGQSAFYTWLFRIVMNLAADRVRQRAARGRAFGTERIPEEDWERVMRDQGVGPDSSAAQTEDRERITKALDTLSEDHRTIIMLSDLEGLSYREIAEVLDVPMGTVMSRLHNARRRLRDALGAFLALVCALVLTWGAGTASAQTPTAPAPPGPDASASPPLPRVHVGARVFLASDGPPPAEVPPNPFPADARVDTYVLKLRQLLRYRQYHPLQQMLGNVPMGTTHRATLAGDRQLELTPEGMRERAVQLRVRLVRGNLTEVTTNIAATPGTAVVIGGPRYSDGVLIILLWANPNP